MILDKLISWNTLKQRKNDELKTINLITYIFIQFVPDNLCFLFVCVIKIRKLDFCISHLLQ